MATIELHASGRSIFGKKVRSLRRNGLLPANVYGHNIPSLALQVETKALARALARAGGNILVELRISGEEEPRKVLVRQVARDPVRRSFLHADFYQVTLTEKLRAEVPLAFVGEAPAAKRTDLVVLYALSALEVECLPADLPQAIEVDLSRLAEADDVIHVADLLIPPRVAVLTDSAEVVARVVAVREEVPVEEAAPAEVELVEGERRKEEQEEGE